MPEKSSKKKPTTEAELRRVLKAVAKRLKTFVCPDCLNDRCASDRKLIARAEAL